MYNQVNFKKVNKKNSLERAKLNFKIKFLISFRKLHTHKKKMFKKNQMFYSKVLPCNKVKLKIGDQRKISEKE